MIESYPDAERSPEPSPFVTTIDYPTAFALEEFIIDQRVGLARSVYVMTSVGLAIMDLKLHGCVIEAHYPHGKRFYKAPEEMNLDKLDKIKRLEVPLFQDIQDSIELLGMQLELSKEQTFIRLIEEARTQRIIRKCNGQSICTYPNGVRQKLVLLQEND